MPFLSELAESVNPPTVTFSEDSAPACIKSATILPSCVIAVPNGPL